jgi:hypothetical protein
VVYVDSNDPGHATEIAVSGQQRRLVATSNRGDQAIDQPPWCHTGSTTLSVDPRRGIEVGTCIEAEEVKSEQQAPQIGFTLVTARP